MMNLEKMKKDLELEFDNNKGDTNLYVSVLTEYCSTAYISDTIHEIADNHTEIYTSELFKNAYDLWLGDYTDRAVTELGADSTDLVNILQSADYLKQMDVLYNNLGLLIKYYAIETLEYTEDYKLIEDKEDFFEDLEKELSDIDSNNLLSAIDDKVYNLVNMYL